MLTCYITDGSGHSRLSWLLPRIRNAAAAGVDFIQIRERDLSARELFEFARAAVREVRSLAGCPTRVLVNERLDIARASGADGVHLPSSALPVARARQLAPPGFLVARSCHHPDEVRQAAREGADFCVLGPIFFTPSKAAYGPPLGLDSLSAAQAAGIPVLALGGITLHNAAECIRHGAAGIAAIRLFQQSDPAAVLDRLHHSTP